ncbi:MAG: hypothetical protein RIE08_13105 [Acidimicrobiales bacterium]
MFDSSTGAGKLRRGRRLLGEDGRTVLVAVDHAAYMGEGPTAEAIAAIAAGAPDGLLAPLHIARSTAADFAHSGLILRIDGGISDLGDPAAEDLSALMYQAELAATLGADAVVILVFPGTPDEHRSLTRLGALCDQCERLGLVVMAEAIPGGWGQSVEWSFENVAKASRLCVELGADMIKTLCPGPAADFAQVVEATPAPVVALGGPRSDSEDDLIDHVEGLIGAGAAGIAFGRNVWGSPDPTALIGRLKQAVHGS